MGKIENKDKVLMAVAPYVDKIREALNEQGITNSPDKYEPGMSCDLCHIQANFDGMGFNIIFPGKPTLQTLIPGTSLQGTTPTQLINAVQVCVNKFARNLQKEIKSLGWKIVIRDKDETEYKNTIRRFYAAVYETK